MLKSTGVLPWALTDSSVITCADDVILKLMGISGVRCVNGGKEGLNCKVRILPGSRCTDVAGPAGAEEIVVFVSPFICGGVRPDMAT